jgi:ABC-2 type transport system permease protein
VLGYFLYAAFYASVGAAVNTPQEAQPLLFPVLIPLILSFCFTPSVLRNPEGSISTILSLIPPLTPILMFARIVAQTPPLWQIGLSVLLMVISIVVVNWCAARVYRIGILMYGKRPTLPEILKWVSMP